MSFNLLILIWFNENHRKLPWRGQTNPYKIWISEVILQQTRVAQGIEYYERFCNAFPTLKSLTEADEDDVLKSWQGLGYYSRAQNLYHTAKHIMNELDGNFPDNYNELLKLKGVGSYTAAAIASICFGEVVPAIDGNAFRVFSRYFNIDLNISDQESKKFFFELAKKIIDQEKPGDFNEAVMELGATVCLPQNPKCRICPLNQSCEALAKNRIHILPVKSKKTNAKTRFFNFLEITNGEQYLMIKRTENDIWKNLYSFPIIESKSAVTDKLKVDKIRGKFIKIHNEIHLLTHQRLEISFWRMEIGLDELEKISKTLNLTAFTFEELLKIPVPKPIERYINQKI